MEAWDKAQECELAPQELAIIIADGLEKLDDFNDPWIDQRKFDLIEEFRNFSQDESLEDDDFSYLMDRLYDWGDVSLDGNFGGKKVCWIKTF